jgi:hypothetical protein
VIDALESVLLEPVLELGLIKTRLELKYVKFVLKLCLLAAEHDFGFLVFVFGVREASLVIGSRDSGAVGGGRTTRTSRPWIGGITGRRLV